MEAKDWKPLLSVPEIHELLYDKGFTEEECEAIIYICKRAGEKEVVGWIHKNGVRNKTIKWWLSILEEEWQAQIKKEWGIDNGIKLG